jgi:hypothetical protein
MEYHNFGNSVPLPCYETYKENEHEQYQLPELYCESPELAGLKIPKNEDAE